MIIPCLKYYVRTLLFLRYIIFVIPILIKMPIYFNPYTLIFLILYDSFCNINNPFFDKTLLTISNINKWHIIKVVVTTNFVFCFSFFVLGFIISFMNNNFNESLPNFYRFLTAFAICSLIGIEISNLQQVPNFIKYFILIISLQFFTNFFNEVLSTELSIPIFLGSIITYIQIRKTYFKKQRFDYDYD